MVRTHAIANLLFILSALMPVACAPSAPPVPTEVPATPTLEANSPPPTEAATATATATATPTVTPTLDARAIHPLAVERMRRGAYPGSDLVFEETLEPGANYDRSRVSYLSEGLKIFALLTVPRGERPAPGWPVIVFNHGYIPPAQYRTTERYVAYVDGFARNGYVVLRPDYRGHDRSEGRASGGYGSPDYSVDVLNAVASIKRYEGADPARIGMWGHSMGGHITLRTMVTTRDVKAGVIWAGVVASYPDLLDRWRRRATASPTSGRSRGWRDALTAAFGSPQENPAFWAAISPNSYLAEISGPVQLHHGTADSSVPFAFSEGLRAELEAAGREVELYVYDGDDHNLSGQFSTAMARSVAFFDTHVKGG